MSHDRNKNHYDYIFSNNVRQKMTPVEAMKYANRVKVDIWQGPNYIKGETVKKFDGWGWHDGLLMTFRGPAHYRQYLKENNMHEAGRDDCPTEEKFEKPVWNEELLKKACALGVEIGSVMAGALLSGELDFPEHET